MEPATLMIVDDEPQNLDVLEAMLCQEGYRVRAFPGGERALAAARERTPDLVLLDIRMPNMDGYEVCRRFKGDPALKGVPVIFLSALSETHDVLRAFEAGAADYVSKPLREAEVLARVRTHLALRRYSQHLEELVDQRTADLQTAHRRLHVLDQAKTHWINMLAHELRTPLTGVFCVTSTLFKMVPPDHDISDLQGDYEWSCGRIRKIIDDALTLATIDVDNGAFECEPVCLVDALLASTAKTQSRVEDIVFALPQDLPKGVFVRASAFLLQRALGDLLFTVACCAPAHSRVDVTLTNEPERAVISLATHGKSLPTEDLATFFEIGGQRTLLKGGADYGLGPVLAYRIIQLFEGMAAIRNGDSGGIVVEVRLPRIPTE